jgi:hypothetical protein
MRGRAASVGLVVGLGFLLLVSLVVDGGINAASGYIDQHFRYGARVLAVLSAACFLRPDRDSLRGDLQSAA